MSEWNVGMSEFLSLIPVSLDIRFGREEVGNNCRRWTKRQFGVVPWAETNS
jgi:hypothetical protein